MEHALGKLTFVISAKLKLTLHFFIDPTVLGLGQMKTTTVMTSSPYRRQLTLRKLQNWMSLMVW